MVSFALVPLTVTLFLSLEKFIGVSTILILDKLAAFLSVTLPSSTVTIKSLLLLLVTALIPPKTESVALSLTLPSMESVDVALIVIASSHFDYIAEAYLNTPGEITLTGSAEKIQ